MLQIQKSRGNIFPSLCQRESLDDVKGLVSGEGTFDKAAWEHSKTADYTMRLLVLEFLKIQHGLLGNFMMWA